MPYHQDERDGAIAFGCFGCIVAFVAFAIFVFIFLIL